MSCDGAGALKCQCLCQLPKHAASLQSEITGGTSDSFKGSYFYSVCTWHLVTLKAFSNKLSNAFTFLLLLLYHLKYIQKTDSPIKSMTSCHRCHIHVSNDRQQSCECNHRKMSERWLACRSKCTHSAGKQVEGIGRNDN